ncbi:MAG: BamA/TamA family outer membrane protein [Williamsia sp.]|nr:BamA/TamA family outer membrane protein [Williamsia sp.]
MAGFPIIRTGLFPLYWMVLACMALLFSCTVPRKYQANKPFVFKTNIAVQGTLEGRDKADLELRLANQLDDSLKTRTVSFAGIRRTLVKPAVFDTNYANRSVLFMNALLNSIGYYQAKINWDSTLRVIGKQQRVTVNFTVVPGKNLKMDSLGFALSDTGLQALAIKNRSATLLKKGDPYSQQVVAAELDRLVEVFKDNGYFKVSREDVYAEVDTVLAALINPTLDPFEQIRLLNEVRLRREHPTINVVIKQRARDNAAPPKKYYIKQVHIHPDLRLFEDSSQASVDTVELRNIKVIGHEALFKPSFLVKNNSLLPGQLFRQKNYYKTVNAFSQLGAWQQVNVDLFANDSLGTIDADINLYPAKKQSLVIDLEATRNAGNTGDVFAVSNLFGVGLNIGLSNRNLARESVRSTTNIRGGVELGTKTNLIQTLQGSLSQNFYFPRFITPFKIAHEEKINSARTILNINTSYTDRRNFFSLGSISGAIGYEWSRRNKVFYYSPLTVELFRLGITDSLDRLFAKVPNLRFSFNNGLVITQNFVFKSLVSRANRITSLKIGVEESGGIFGLIPKLDKKGGLYRYVKSDLEYHHLIKRKRADWAFRLYGGIGIPYGKQADGSTETGLPFYKSFFAGGPNSMRAWQVRRLGPGSSDSLQTYDRFGDISLEGNIEYRFNLFSIGTVKVKSALFSDVGNIWNRTTFNNPNLANTEFKPSRLYRDLAVAAGTSLRFDFSYFLVRFDWAYKVKNPVYSKTNAGWFQNVRLNTGQFQLGIGYPF